MFFNQIRDKLINQIEIEILSGVELYNMVYDGTGC